MKFKTGIPKLDEFLDGGLIPGTATIFWTQPGVSNAPFCYQLINSILSENHNVIYVVQTKRPDTIEQEITDAGWDVKKHKEEGNFKFIDAYSAIVNTESTEKLVVGNPKDIKEFSNVIENHLSQNEKCVVIFDSLSTLVNDSFKDLLTEMKKWKDLFLRHDSCGVFLFTEWPYGEEITTQVRELADSIVELKAIEEKVILREYFTVPKVSWGNPIKRGVPFKVVVPGGIKVYIPKVLVTGDFNAGKSSFVHSASDTAVSVDRIGTTVALDHGHLDYRGFSVDLFGSPGQERFDPLLKMLGNESLGVIVMVDATDPGTFSRALSMLKKSNSEGLPYVVAANKANKEGALPVEEIRQKMGLDVPIIELHAQGEGEEGKPCQLKKEDVHKTLDALFDKII
ncbi:MAG: ATPase domain-containing protein [Candidatus Woesearchaeota archaeon]